MRRIETQCHFVFQYKVIRKCLRGSLRFVMHFEDDTPRDWAILRKKERESK